MPIVDACRFLGGRIFSGDHNIDDVFFSAIICHIEFPLSEMRLENAAHIFSHHKYYSENSTLNLGYIKQNLDCNYIFRKENPKKHCHHDHNQLNLKANQNIFSCVYNFGVLCRHIERINSLFSINFFFFIIDRFELSSHYISY